MMIGLALQLGERRDDLEALREVAKLVFDSHHDVAFDELAARPWRGS